MSRSSVLVSSTNLVALDFLEPSDEKDTEQNHICSRISPLRGDRYSTDYHRRHGLKFVIPCSTLRGFSSGQSLVVL